VTPPKIARNLLLGSRPVGVRLAINFIKGHSLKPLLIYPHSPGLRAVKRILACLVSIDQRSEHVRAVVENIRNKYPELLILIILGRLTAFSTVWLSHQPKKMDDHRPCFLALVWRGVCTVCTDIEGRDPGSEWALRATVSLRSVLNDATGAL
jgi:hypothetical protein